MPDNIQLPAMRIHCIGRYLIDLPEEYIFHPENDLTLYYGLGKDFKTLKVFSSPLPSGVSFKQLILKARWAFEADEHFESPSKNMLAEVREINPDLVLIRSYYSPDIVDMFKLHLYARRGNTVTRIEGRKASDKINSTPLEQVESRLLRLAQNTQFFEAPEKAGRGSCLGSVTVDDGQDGEVFSLYFFSEKHPDVKLSIDMNSLPEKGDGGLLKRVDSKAGLFQKFGISSTTLRRGKRQIAGRSGEELLDAGKHEGKIERLFTAETLVTEPSSITRPVIAISMTMGGQNKDGAYVDPSLSEKEALAWWDAIVGSIRPRP